MTISGGWVVLKIPVVTSGFAMNVPVFEHPLPLPPPKKNGKMDIKLHYPISFVVAPFSAARSININFHSLKGRKLEISQVLESHLIAKLRGFHSVQRCVVVSSLP